MAGKYQIIWVLHFILATSIDYFCSLTFFLEEISSCHQLPYKLAEDLIQGQWDAKNGSLWMPKATAEG